jgi:hypothetical protein
VHSAPQSAFIGFPFFSLHGWNITFVVVTISTSSLTAQGAGSRGRNGRRARICGKEIAGGRIHGRPCDDDGLPKVTGAFCH